jgi:hypothetical protein
MSSPTVLIPKERLSYLEYLEANMNTIVQNAVYDIIQREPIKRAKKPSPRPDANKCE